MTCESLNTLHYSAATKQCVASASSFAYTYGSSAYGAPATALPTGTSHSSSKAWIAGAVIGPVFGLAILIGLGILICTVRKQTKQRQLSQQQQQQPVPAPTEEPKGTWVFVPAGPTAPVSQTGSPSLGRSPHEPEVSAEPHIAELSSQREIVELDQGARNT